MALAVRICVRDVAAVWMKAEAEAEARRRRKRLFEELKSVVAVHHLDGVANGLDLLGAELATLIPLLLLDGAILLEVGFKLGVFLNRLLRLLQVRLGLHGLNSDSA